MSASRPSLPPPSARVLLVEDEAIIAKDIEQSLERMGYVVCGAAATGADAIRKAEETKPDLILMDIRLRGEMDGIEAARRILASRDLPIIFLTAFADDSTLQRAREVGPYGYVLKPFDENELYVTTMMALTKHRAFAQLDRLVEERTRALAASEAQMRELDELLRLFVENVRDYAIFLLRPDGTVASWNKGAENLTGYKADEVIGTHLSRFYAEAERAAGKLEQELRTAARDGVAREEGFRVRKDGSRFWADVTATALHGDAGALRGFIKIMRDTTEQRRAEEILQRANEDLEERVRSRTAALTAANKELEAFSYSVSHDLRAPLRAVDGFARMLAEGYADRLDDKGRHYLNRIRAGAQRMGALIDDLLKLSRLGRAELRPASVDLAALAREVVDELRRREPERQVEVILPDRLCITGDRQLLRAALDNLIGNAWKFTRKTPAARVELGRAPAGGGAAYFVRDNGAGFEMEYVGQLFTPFKRLHDEKDFEGTGIGLATVQRVVARHGGRVWAEGAPGRGATFWFTLEEGT